MENFKLRHYESKDYIYAVGLNKIHIKLEVLFGEVDSISIKYWKRFREEESVLLELDNYSFDKKSPYFDVFIESKEQFRYLNYVFLIVSKGKKYFYSKDGVSNDFPLRFFEFQYVNKDDIFDSLDVFKGRVGYHVFVDRFYREGNVSGNKKIVEWDESPTRDNVFGGNFLGVFSKLDYLKDLGISLIIFMPIFKAASNHKYDTIDYFEVDPSYGTKEDLKKLISKAHELDIKIVFDGVFNHIGYYSEQFLDAKENKEKSKYFSWFSFVNDGEIEHDYLAVGDYKWMPKLNYQSLELRQFIIKVGRYWIDSFDIDGWRLDVFDEIEESFRNEFSKEIKKSKKDLLLIGETWHDGYELLSSKQVHSVMNYLYRNYILDYFIDCRISENEFLNKLQWLSFRYPKPLLGTMYNLLGSHDTERIMTRAKEDMSKIIQVYAFLILSLGIPVIYYGDELGMIGEVDPGCRKAMEWDRLGNNIYLKIKELIKYRNDNEAIRFGDIKYLVVDNCFGFIRVFGNEKILVLFNTLDESIEVSLEDIFVKRKVVVEKNGYSCIKLY